MTEFRERRARPRVEEPFPVTVRGIDVTGERLDIDTVLDNVSEGGLDGRIPRRIEPGSRVTVGVRLYDAETHGQGQGPGARVAARGVVLRVNPGPDGDHAVAVAFKGSRVF